MNIYFVKQFISHVQKCICVDSISQMGFCRSSASLTRGENKKVTICRTYTEKKRVNMFYTQYNLIVQKHFLRKRSHYSQQIF